MTNSLTETDVAIIGAGPVGLFAAFQCSMLRLRCVLIDVLPQIGGQCTTLYPEKPIYDIPAHPAIEGAQLIANLERQIEAFTIPRLLEHKVEQLSGRRGDFLLVTHKQAHIHAKAVIIAAGAGAFCHNRPPLEGLKDFEKRGAVQYCVQNKAEFQGKSIVIAGGGDSALDWALALSEYATKIYLVHRRDHFRGSPESLHRLDQVITTGRIEKIVPYQLHALHGENGTLHHVDVIHREGDIRSLNADVLLPFFGLTTDLGPIALWRIDTTRTTIPVTPSTCETSLAGVFAIGDIAHYPGKLKLILQGFSEAAMAAHAVYPIVYPDHILHFEHSTTKGVPSF
ncbi:MAG: NAD(P)/FAD-dependent oxidoreductase [Acetobacter sp.]|nr:NAD(P)/FAD-dependent oxidoreductase [Acetobacter sp.]